VQGVWFRASTADEASRLGLVGWVRNLPGGDVELMARGSAPALARLREWLAEGPPLARVERVEWDEWAQSDLPLPAKFEIR
jgi:acylphosphatase